MTRTLPADADALARITQRLIDESHESDCPASGLHSDDRGPEDACECWAEDVNWLIGEIERQRTLIRDLTARLANAQHYANEDSKSIESLKQRLANLKRDYKDA